QLANGYRLAGIGGSDNHRPEIPLEKPGSVGSPTTVVYAAELSVPAILAALRAGHVFIDLTASRDRLLELSATSGDRVEIAGDTLEAPANSDVKLTLHTVACQGSVVSLALDGRSDPQMKQAKISEKDQTLSFTWHSDGKKHWLRADITSPDNTLQLVG